MSISIILSVVCGIYIATHFKKDIEDIANLARWIFKWFLIPGAALYGIFFVITSIPFAVYRFCVLGAGYASIAFMCFVFGRLFIKKLAVKASSIPE